MLHNSTIVLTIFTLLFPFCANRPIPIISGDSAQASLDSLPLRQQHTNNLVPLIDFGTSFLRSVILLVTFLPRKSSIGLRKNSLRPRESQHRYRDTNKYPL